MIDIVLRLEGATLDKDNFPRMDSERQVPVGLAKEAKAEIERLRAALGQCEEYFDNRSDVKDGDYGAPEPNEEMRLLSEVRGALSARECGRQ